jgi:hypothetical protein
VLVPVTAWALLPCEDDVVHDPNAQIAAVPMLAGDGSTRPEAGHPAPSANGETSLEADLAWRCKSHNFTRRPVHDLPKLKINCTLGQSIMVTRDQPANRLV